ncbi:cytochrome P450 [Cryptosporangium arvum]|uniref:Cytochrome P450 n=1 Tax=Cryptosporangium arvum DSM 44712 TaxID=927661 RepID=A0A011AKY3_9ACTN|nr:cytochrome P450 [Cryptosporangium arvum]EXG82621.1 cytochrome P450 [Cryptosporangium arvum DSM 44712]
MSLQHGVASADRGTPPAVPGALPLLGHVVPLLRRPLEFMDELRRHGPVVRLGLGRVPVYVVTDAQLTYSMLTAESGSFHKGGRLIEALSRFAGNGLATVPDGDRHRRQRRLMQPMFSRSFIAGRAGVMIETARSVVGGWAPGEPRRTDDDMQELTLSVFLSALLGAQPPTEVRREFQRVLPDVMAGTIRATILPRALGAIPTPTQRRYQASLRDLRTAIGALIDAHGARSNDGGPADPDRAGLLDLLLDAADPESGQRMSRTQLEDEVITFVTTNGQASTASILWALYEVGRDPDVERKVHAELDAVCGQRPLRAEDLKSLTYLRRIIHETMRLYGPAWLLTRKVSAPGVLGDFVLPAGADVVFSPYVIHRDPVVYPDPARFDPGRWSPERAASIPRTAFLPFGAGTRQCIGDNFAWDEMTIILAETFRQWRMTPTGDRAPKPVPRVTIHPDRLVMTPEPVRAA